MFKILRLWDAHISVISQSIFYWVAQKYSVWIHYSLLFLATPTQKVYNLRKAQMTSPYGKKSLFYPQIDPYMVPNFILKWSLFGPY